MNRTLVAKPLTAEAFAPFGDVLACEGPPDKMINDGLCARFHDRARVDMADRAGISMFRSELRSLPYELTLVERHPLGSQAFIPLGMEPFLVIVADAALRPQAFVTGAGQGINFHRGTWHGVLTPLTGAGIFAVIDNIGAGANLEEHVFAAPYTITTS